MCKNMRDPRHDILFEPINIGPVTSKNRFYQVPHCSGMGWRRPNTLAAMRGVKAEGGWGVVNTEYCSIHPTSDNDAFPYCALWDNEDIISHRKMTDEVHKHGALAGVELWIGGSLIVNLGTRLPPLGLRNHPQQDTSVYHPGQTRCMDKNDIKNIRKWHRDAAKRALEAGFDIVYVYATHGYLLSEFLNPETNIRSDEYGGPLENRVRFIKELIEDTREIVDGKAAVATRFSVGLNDSESYDAFALLADLPDLWDLTVPDYSVEMGNSRFIKEAALKDSVLKARQLTSKPVVSVGRLTSPDTMVQLLRENVQDLIGAARPSIADPFLPNKISTGNLEDIRECIGCNVCYAHDSLGVPIRCTQNPTMGEEWRNGWHPEKILTTKKRKKVLVVGSGPAGLEASRVLGEMGHKVALAEKSRELGGRIITEAKLPGLSEWIRVRDWRITQINKCQNIEVFPESFMTSESVLELGYENVVIATGARWAKDSIGRHSNCDFREADIGMIISGDEVLEKPVKSKSKFVVYDDDHYYFGSVLALELKRQGHQVTLVCPAGRICSWGEFTDEQTRSNTEVIQAGIKVINNYKIEAVTNGIAELSCVFSGETKEIFCDFVIPITRKIPVTDLYDDLCSKKQEFRDNGIEKIMKIGDAEAPSIIAAAVHSGYRSAIEIDNPASKALNFAKREHPLIK